MNDQITKINIPDLIVKKLTSTGSSAEITELNNWLSKKENQKIYESILQKIKEGKHYESYHSIQPDTKWEALNKITKSHRKIQLRSILKYAALITIPVTIATFLVFRLYTPVDNELETYSDLHLPGSSKAQLTTDDGNVYDLESMQIKKIPNHNIEISEKKLIYKKSIDQPRLEEKYQYINVPTGGEWFIELADGTKVWINSESNLKVPEYMIGSERVIEMDGEAYFEVASNPDKPFIVKTKKGRVEVLGTKFNIRAYNDEEVNVTTLVEGSISLEHPFNKLSKVKLSPGDQAEIISVNHRIRINKVNTSDFIAWKDQRFVFNQESLESILNKLSRWYGAEFRFEEEPVKQIRLTADIKRFTNLSTILSFIEEVAESPVEFKVEDDTLVVSKK